MPSGSQGERRWPQCGDGGVAERTAGGAFGRDRLHPAHHRRRAAGCASRRWRSASVCRCGRRVGPDAAIARLRGRYRPAPRREAASLSVTDEWRTAGAGGLEGHQPRLLAGSLARGPPPASVGAGEPWRRVGWPICAVLGVGPRGPGCRGEVRAAEHAALCRRLRGEGRPSARVETRQPLNGGTPRISEARQRRHRLGRRGFCCRS